jgi:hypothetical protein
MGENFNAREHDLGLECVWAAEDCVQAFAKAAVHLPTDLAEKALHLRDEVKAWFGKCYPDQSVGTIPAHGTGPAPKAASGPVITRHADGSESWRLPPQPHIAKAPPPPQPFFSGGDDLTGFESLGSDAFSPSVPATGAVALPLDWDDRTGFEGDLASELLRPVPRDSREPAPAFNSPATMTADDSTGFE